MDVRPLEPVGRTITVPWVRAGQTGIETMKLPIAIIAGAVGISAGLLATSPASALSSNLHCHNGFARIAAYPDAIKCRKAESGFADEDAAKEAAKNWTISAGCNANMTSPRRKVWYEDGEWKVAVTFICANISWTSRSGREGPAAGDATAIRAPGPAA